MASYSQRSPELNPETDLLEIVVTNRPAIVPPLIELNGTVVGLYSAPPEPPPGEAKADMNVDTALKVNCAEVYVPSRVSPSYKFVVNIGEPVIVRGSLLKKSSRSALFGATLKVTTSRSPALHGTLKIAGIEPMRSASSTEIAMLPGESIRPAGTCAVSCVALTKEVASGAPFHITVEPELNPEPFTVSVNPGPSRAAELGLMPVIDGTEGGA